MKNNHVEHLGRVVHAMMRDNNPPLLIAAHDIGSTCIVPAEQVYDKTHAEMPKLLFTPSPIPMNRAQRRAAKKKSRKR